MVSTKKGLKVIAALEGSKGICSILIAFGLHVLAGQNLQQVAESIVRYVNLDPTSHFPSVFITTASNISQGDINLVICLVLFYALIRLIEAYGLWKGLLWIEWFALISGAIYLPFEIYEIILNTNILSVGVFFINVCVVVYMFQIVRGNKGERILEKNGLCKT